MELGFAWSGLFAQISSGGGNASPTPAANLSVQVALLSLRRWCDHLTLSTPDAAPGLFSPALGSWLAGLAGLLVVAAALQGPGRMFAQAFDLAGHFHLLRQTLRRLRRAGRMVAAVVGLTIVSWTSSQAYLFNRPERRDDVLLLMRGHNPFGVAVGQAFGAALTPLRSIHVLGTMNLALLVAMVVLFRFSNDRWGSTVRPPREIRVRVHRWATIGWCGAAVYGIYYRLIMALAKQGVITSGGCLLIEFLIVPVLLTLGSGIVLAWILTELRGVSVQNTGEEGADVLGTVVLIPSALAATLFCIPSALLTLALLMLTASIPNGSPIGVGLAPILRWGLNWGLFEVQAASLVFVGLAGATAWSGGGIRDAFRSYGRMLANEGGRVVALVATASAAAGVGSGLVYVVFLNLPASTWLLAAADSYAHYVTLLVGLLLLAAFVELGERTLPVAIRADQNPVKEQGSVDPTDLAAPAAEPTSIGFA